MEWQNKILGLGFKDTYCQSINNQLVAHLYNVERSYNYKNRPGKKIQTIRSRHASTINFCSKEEFDTFVSQVDDESANLYFKFFFTGLHADELIEVSIADIDFDGGHIDITRSA